MLAMLAFIKRSVHFLKPCKLQYSLLIDEWRKPMLKIAVITVGLWLLSSTCVQVQAAVILQYHQISDSGPTATRVSPELFAKHLDYLQRNQYRVVPLAELIAALRAGISWPDKTVAITFDDGYDSIYEYALPLLAQRQWPFTVFINTQPVDDRWHGFMNWSQLRELASQGATIANHGASHEHMVRRRADESRHQWLQRLEAGIVLAEQRILAETGQQHRWLAYPYGEYNRAIQGLLRKLDYVGLAQHSGPLAEHTELTAMPRFPFGGIYGDLDDFAIKVASLPFPLESVAVENEAGDVLTDPLLPAPVTKPVLWLTLVDKTLVTRTNCFASGQGQIPVKADQLRLRVQALQPLPAGRSRYNCTAPSKKSGRFHWYSQSFIRKKVDGSWYSEP
jgi:peptidoglycan/xylan/chitin deacetylase (PgdA/CDA1 family)